MAVWIALAAVFIALIPVFVIAARSSNDRKPDRGDGSGDGASTHIESDSSDGGDGGGGGD